MFFFKKYRTIIFVVSVLVLALGFVFCSVKYGSEQSFLKKVVMETASPLQHVLDFSIQSVRDAWQRYILLVGVQDENKKLKKKIDELETTIVQFREDHLEAQRLRKLFDIENDSHYQFICARVIGKDYGAISRTLLINKGLSNGLKPGMPVIAPPGLIGRLTDVSWHYAKVLLLIDESSNVDAIVQRSRTQGIITGAGSRGMFLKYVSQTQDVQKGDVVVSSGMGGIFPAGLLIGQVHHVDRKNTGLFLKIEVLPFADVSKLEEVLILSSAAKEIK